MPLVSIGMPVFNGAESIAASIDSLLAQTVGDFELVICDTASTDATADVCARYAARDARIRYHRNPRNLGVNPNYNLTLSYASAPFFKWASANDLCAPTFLERCLAPLEADPAVVLAYPRTTLIDGAGAAIEPYDDGLDLREVHLDDLRVVTRGVLQQAKVGFELGANRDKDGLDASLTVSCGLPFVDGKSAKDAEEDQRRLEQRAAHPFPPLRQANRLGFGNVGRQCWTG